MMKGRLFIDGLDAFTEYGVFVEQYGYKQLVQRPAFKKLTSTNWPEEDGEEVDLISPVLDTRTLQIQFCIRNVRYAEDLFDVLSNGAYHEFEFVDLQKTYKLRMSQNGSFSQFVKLGKLTLTFSDDFPEVPTGKPMKWGKSGIRQVGFEIDGVDMSQFGAYVLKGTDESIRKAPNTKDNLKIDSAAAAGVVYDDENVQFKTKDITLKLLIDAPSIGEFWARYDALFSVLMQPEERLFFYDALVEEYTCYYKQCSVQKFEILRNGKVWCEFDVTLTFTSVRPVGQYMLLATEDYDFATTEDGAKIIIRPKYGISLVIMEDGAYLVTEADSDKIYINNTN